MPKIKDKRVSEGKKNRNRAIRKYFDKRWNDGLRTEVIYDEVIAKWGLSASSINKILKQTDDEDYDNNQTKKKNVQTSFQFEEEGK